MDSSRRRERVLDMIRRQDSPVSASVLAQTLNVSRQVIVGDVALLRAQGSDIISTARGYMIAKIAENNRYIGKIACRHAPEQTLDELYAIVDLGAVALDVIVEHELYGEITGCLNLSRRSDIDAFVEKSKSSKDKLLSELTMGIHLHTIACRDRAHFKQVCKALEQKGCLLRD